jgi:hypothetical protein
MRAIEDETSERPELIPKYPLWVRESMEGRKTK